MFAKSADGYFWVAKVLEINGPSVRVRFLNAGEMQVGVADLRNCTFLPGQRVMCMWPDYGWWTSIVQSYDEDSGMIRASDGFGTDGTFKISEIRMTAPKMKKTIELGTTSRINIALIAVSAFGGGVVGAAITWLLMR